MNVNNDIGNDPQATQTSRLAPWEIRRAGIITLAIVTGLCIAATAVAIAILAAPAVAIALAPLSGYAIYMLIAAPVAIIALVFLIKLAIQRCRPFIVCTYNIGSSVTDYFNLVKYDQKVNHENPNYVVTQNDNKAFIQKYQRIKVEAANALALLADLFCLQEVAVPEEAFIAKLKENGFAVYHGQGASIDSAIAISNSRFNNIVDYSRDVSSTVGKRDIAIVTATDVFTGERHLFVSAHIPGYDLDDPRDEYLDGDQICQQVSIAIDDVVAQEARNGHSVKVRFIGADMNSFPESWQGRFDIFRKRGFSVHRTHSDTNVLPLKDVVAERELDYGFTNFTWSQYGHVSLIGTELGFDPEKNPSDHLPVFFKID